MTNKEIKAYLAGILDGEGYVGITTRKRTNGKNYVPTISIGLSDKGNAYDVLNLFKERYGGCVYDKKVYNYTNSFKARRPSKGYYIVQQKAALLAKDLLPFLIIKKEQARLLISCASNPCKADKKGLPEKERARRESLYLGAKTLNN